MSDFRVGDKVRCVSSYGGGVRVGEVGVVVRVRPDRLSVRWDNYSDDRHSCGGLCEAGHGWNIPNGFVEHEYSIVDLGELPILDVTSIL